jgi:hypothetical protein
MPGPTQCLQEWGRGFCVDGRSGTWGVSERDGVVGPQCDYQRLWGTGWRNVHDANGAL